MEKLKQKLIAIREILMDRGVLYNIEVQREGEMIKYRAARGNAITVVGGCHL